MEKWSFLQMKQVFTTTAINRLANLFLCTVLQFYIIFILVGSTGINQSINQACSMNESILQQYSTVNHDAYKYRYRTYIPIRSRMLTSQTIIINQRKNTNHQNEPITITITIPYTCKSAPTMTMESIRTAFCTWILCRPSKHFSTSRIMLVASSIV